jgi:hypothetical protein
MVTASASHTKTFIWFGMSKEAIEVVRHLEHIGAFHFHPTLPVTYLIDGMGIPLLLTTACKNYREPHWPPVVLKRGALPCGENNCLRRVTGITRA